jgi:hypothetical protein
LLYAEGGNFRVDLTRTVAICSVWSRPDVSRETGMAYARETAIVFAKLAGERKTVVRAAVLDLHEAPKTWGPVTQGHLEEMVRSFEMVKRRIAVVSSDDALQVLQLKRLVKTRAPTHGRVFASVEDAVLWAAVLPPSE